MRCAALFAALGTAAVLAQTPADQAAAKLKDPKEGARLEAIGELVRMFLAEQPTSRRYKGGIIEVRRRSGVTAAFDAGPAVTNGQVAPPDVIKGLTAAMGDTSARVRHDATYAFGILVPDALLKTTVEDLKPGIDTLRAGLHDSSSDIRVAAARVLGRIFSTFGGACAGLCAQLGGAEVGDGLIDAMNDRSGSVRRAAMEALGAIRNERAVKALEERFNYHRTGDEAEAALDALARIGNPGSVPLFKSLLSSKNVTIQRLAIEGVARAGATDMALEIEDLPKSSRTDETQIATAFALHKLGRGNHMRTLFGAAFVSSTAALARQYMVELGPSIAPDLYPNLLEQDPRTKILAADILGEIGNKGAIARLQPLTADKDPQVAAAARRAIARLE